MRYEVDVAGRRLRVEMDADGRVLVGDEVVAYDARDLAAGRLWSVVIEGRAHEVVLVGGVPALAEVDGTSVTIAVADERAIAARTDRIQAAGGRHEVRAPMPGLLKAVHVTAGDVVERGTALATLEAMKMENELRAPSRARVQRVAVGAGTKVESGALIAVLVDEPA